MKDLMLYTEENLLFSPELCYDPEVVLTKEDKDEISKEPPANRPLILPKSTLVDKTVGPPPGFKYPTVPLGMEKRNVDSLLELNNDPPLNQNFTEKSSLQSGSNIYNSQIMTPGQLIHLWNKNLELQMQITEAFQALLPKMTPGTANACNNYNGSANDSLQTAHVASHMNLFDGLNIAKNMAATKSTMNESIYMNSLPKNTHTDHINSVMPNIYEQNTVPMMFGRQNTKTIDPVCTLSQNFDKLSISQNTAFQTSLLSHEIPSGNSTKIMAQENAKSNDTDDERLLNGMFKETNPFRLSLAGKLRIPSPEEDHAQNFFTSNYNNTSSGNYKPVHTVNVSSQTTDDQNTAPSTQYRYQKNLIQKNLIQKNLIHEPQRQCNIPNMYFNTEEYHNGHTRMNHDSSASKINTSYSDKVYSNGTWLVDNKNSSSDDIRRQEASVELQTSIFQNNYETKSNHNYPYPCKDSHFQINLNEEDEGSFSMESVLQRPQKDFDRAPSRQKVANKNEFRVQSFPDSADSIYTNNLHYTNGWPGNCYNDLKSNEPSWSPITGFTSPLSIENTDEGYQTRPSTSNLLENALLLPQTVTETSSTRDVIKAVHKHNNMSTNSWKNIANYNFENDESKLFSQSIFSQHPTVNNCEPNETWNANGLLKNTENLIITEAKTSDAKHREEVCKKFELFKCGPDLYCRPFELPKCLVHIFHYKEEGWMLIADFVDAFAEFKSLTYMINLLHILDLKIEYLDLEQYSFSRIPQLQSKLRRISEDGKAGPPRVHLMPLEDSMKVLLKLGIITTSEIYSAVVKKEFVIGSVTHQISMVITAYNECAKVIEGCDHAEYS